MRKNRNTYYLTILFIIIQFQTFSINISLRRVCLSSNNDVVIFWNIPKDTCSNFVQYIIYGMSSVPDGYKVRDTIGNREIDYYTDKNALLESVTWKYYIVAKFNCGGDYIIVSDTLEIDKIPPEDLDIDTVSVDSNGVRIGWSKSKSVDAKGYIVYYLQASGNSEIIRTINDKNDTSFYDTIKGNPNNKSEGYRIAVFDSCGNTAPISEVHNTLLMSLSQDRCLRIINLDWNRYNRWKESDVKYEIMISKDGGPFQIQKVITGSNSYIFKDGENGTNYDIFIRARNIKRNFTTSSNIINHTADFIIVPDYIYLKNVTVNDEKIEIYWAIEKVGDIQEFNILRGSDTSNMNQISNILYDNSLEYSFIDMNVDVYSKIYFYKIQMVDVCSNNNFECNFGKNILLRIEDNSNYKALKWNNYEQWEGGVSRNNIYIRNNDSIQVWILNREIDDNKKEYEYRVKGEEIKGQKVCYKIIAEEGNDNKYGFSERSSSNEVCVTGGHIVYIPSAFAPNGENKIFIPKGKLIDYSNSWMRIYNRWGVRVFEKEGIEDGWDGKIKGSDAEGGIYQYIIKIVGEGGGFMIYRGKLTLVR